MHSIAKREASSRERGVTKYMIPPRGLGVVGPDHIILHNDCGETKRLRHAVELVV